jgi:hypothetical protein
MPSPPSKNIPRACLFNLVAYAPNAKRLPRILEIVHAIGSKFPCRLVLITHAQEAAGVRVETLPNPCVKQKNGYDQVFIYADSEKLNKVPFLVMPYLIPDLPINLLWDEDPTSDDPVLNYLKGFATRIIFDASGIEDWSAFAHRMGVLIGQNSYDYMDISWALISSWRDTVARLFNDAQALDELRRCQKVRILCRHSTDYATGIYLLSWLSAQLDWKLVQSKQCEGVIETTFAFDKANIATAIAEQPSTVKSEHGIASVEIVTSSGTVYQMTHRPACRTVITHVIHDSCCDLPITLPFACLNQSFAFMKELLHHRSSSHYRNMLSKLTEFKNVKKNHS